MPNKAAIQTRIMQQLKISNYTNNQHNDFVDKVETF
jgi:hypothetical protein